MSHTYANLPQRIKAVFIDTLIIVGLMYGISEIFNLFNSVPNIVRIIAFIAIFILYDPLLTSIYGGTMGHAMLGIEIKQQAHPKKNISFPYALLRFLLKAALGWISLLSVTSSEKKQALHDLAAKSVVLEIEKKQAEVS